MTAEQIARALHAQLHNTGYPYLAPSVHRTAVFPRVELWNAKLPSAQVIIWFQASSSAPMSGICSACAAGFRREARTPTGRAPRRHGTLISLSGP